MRIGTSLVSLMAALWLTGTIEASGGSTPSASPPSNLPLLFAAFAVTWAAFFVYLFYLAWKEREVRKEMRALRRALEEKETKGRES